MRTIAKIAFILITITVPLLAQETIPVEMRDKIDKAATEILAKTGAPSASIAVVRDGKIAYVHAYGTANLESKAAATPTMRYSIGSISKQFTAAAVLLLAEQGKLSLDDRLVRWFPDLTRSGDVTIRELLSMTSGYQDFWPQDYVMPMMMQPTTAQAILNGWAKKPLDFEPGTKYQYSNTNYVIAGLIVEKATGMPLLDFLQKHIFGPLNMTTFYDSDAAALGANEPQRYLRYALGPLRTAPKEGRGWMYAAGELAMTARDLALWDISILDQTVLQPASYRQMESEVQLANGVGARYGLGVSIAMTDGRKVISHGGEVSGFTAHNAVYPDQRAAVAVLTNLDATTASEQIATRVAGILLATNDPATQSALEQAKKIFDGLQHGTIERSLFTDNANAYFSDPALKDFASSLEPLGKPQEFTQQSQALRGGMTLRRFRIHFAQKTLRAWTYTMPDGKLEQYMVAAVE